MRIRMASPNDAAAIQAILRPTIEASAITFHDAIPSVESLRVKIAAALETFPWLVLEDGAQVIGEAAASRYRASEGTRWGVETSIALGEAARGRGLGTRLYGALLDGLKELGFCNAYAGITLPNPASVRLHERLGFETVGIFRRTGFKLGLWHDSIWMQKALTPAAQAPGPRRPVTELRTFAD